MLLPPEEVAPFRFYIDILFPLNIDRGFIPNHQIVRMMDAKQDDKHLASIQHRSKNQELITSATTLDFLGENLGLDNCNSALASH